MFKIDDTLPRDRESGDTLLLSATQQHVFGKEQ